MQYTEGIYLCFLTQCIDNNTLVTLVGVPTGSPSRGGDVAVCAFGINQLELAHSFFYSVLVSVSIVMALSTVFHSINSPDNSPLSHSVLPALLLPYWRFH